MESASSRFRILTLSVLLSLIFSTVRVFSDEPPQPPDENAPKTSTPDVSQATPADVSKADAEAAEPQTEDVAKQPSEEAPAEPVDPLVKRIDELVDISSRRFLTAEVHTPWQILHGVLALGQDFYIKAGASGEKVRAVDWLADRSRYRGEFLFEVTQFGGRAHPYSVPYAFEGHPNQFLAILSMWLPLDFQFQTRTGTITVAQMVENAKKDVNSRDEVTWTLWTLSNYLEPDAQWLNKYGEPWSMERLVRMQTEEPVQNAPCGGTHGLFALSLARNRYLEAQGQLGGAWLEADQKIRRYIETARTLQNRDGSFSTRYFEGMGTSGDYAKRLETSGHMLEWLSIGLPRERLNDDWVRNAVDALSQDMLQNKAVPVDTGPLYHALDGLLIYRNRIHPKAAPAAPAAKVADTTVSAGNN